MSTLSTLSQFQFDEEQKRTRSRGIQVMENFVTIAFTAVKCKSTAQHYQTQVESHAATGSHDGELAHSRKQFVGILRAAKI